MTRDRNRYGPALPRCNRPLPRHMAGWHLPRVEDAPPRLRGNILTDLAAGALTACLVILIAAFVCVL